MGAGCARSYPASFYKGGNCMVSIKQIEKGIGSYLDHELMPQLPQDGIEKVIIGTGISLLLKKNIGKIDNLRKNPVINAMGIFDKDGNVDIDTLREELKEHMPESGVKYEVPMIGTLTFKGNDVDVLYNHIVH